MDLLYDFARQLKAETNQREIGRLKNTNATIKAEQRSYASNTIYGQTILKHHTELIANEVQDRLHLLRRGKAAVDAVVVNKHLKEANHETLAVIGLKVMLDVLGKESKPVLADLTVPLGQAVEVELRLSHYFNENPDLYKRIEKSFHSSTGTRQKASVFRLRFNRENIDWKPWTRRERHIIGSFLLDCINRKTSWVKKETITQGKKSKKTCMRYSEDFLGLKEAIINKAQHLAFCAEPMFCEPLDWSNEESGGWLTSEVKDMFPLVRTHSGSLPRCKQGDIPIRTLNNMQHVKFKVDTNTLAVVKWAKETGQTIGKFRIENRKDFTATLPEHPSEEELKDYKRLRRDIENFNAQLEQKNYRTLETVLIAEKFADEPKFYIPMSFGYRGRIYCLTHYLNPQGTDLDKSLLLFADESPVDEYWLAFHCATTHGLDKESLMDRVAWTRANTDHITKVATNPIDNRDLWITAEEPWTHLQSCYWYWLCCIAKKSKTSGLMIGIDATCSALQHLSAATRSYSGGSLVNLTPSDKPKDGYAVVAEVSKQYIRPELHKYIDRKTVKRVCMTTSYGLTYRSAKGYIREALIEKGCDLSQTGVLKEVTDAVYRKAVPEVFDGAIKLMNFWRTIPKQVLESRDRIQWTTPSGFEVVQDLRFSQTTRVDTRLMGSVIACQLATGWGKPDMQHHIGAISPNIVHSWDSSLIHLTFSEPEFTNGNIPFACVHDCVLGRSSDMTFISKLVRQKFVDMYKQNILMEWCEQVGVTFDESVMVNTLNIQDVLLSDYFFC